MYALKNFEANIIVFSIHSDADQYTTLHSDTPGHT